MVTQPTPDSRIFLDSLHPKDIYSEELRLAKEFVMGHPCSGGLDPCPISNEKRHDILFSKWGQQYAFSPTDWNLSLASTPDPQTLHSYFYASPLARFRATPHYQTMATERRQPLWCRLRQWLETRIQTYIPGKTVSLADWGTKFTGWAEYLAESASINRFSVCEPLPPVQPADQDDAYDVILLQDALQRAQNPAALLAKTRERLKNGGILIVTCRSGTGFDILSLRENSASIFPYDHICLPSPKGLESILRASGYEILESSTPGLLDMQLIREGRLPADQLFQRYLRDALSPDDDDKIQAFLGTMKLSSHLRVIARKP